MALNKTRNSTTEITLSDVIRDNTDSSLLGYTASGTGAVTDRTVQDKLRETVSVKDFGAKGDGVTDDTAAIQAAFDTGKPVHFPLGTYVITSRVDYVSSESITITADKGAVIDATAISASATTIYAMWLSGQAMPANENTVLLSHGSSRTGGQALGANASKGDSAITVPTALGLTKGDIIRIYSTDDFTSTYGGTPKGEMAEVYSVTGTAVTLTAPIADSYTAATTTVFKHTAPKVSVSDLTLLCAAKINGLTVFEAREVEVSNVHVEGAYITSLRLDLCYGGKVSNCSGKDFRLDGASNEYGLGLGSCQSIEVCGNHFEGGRHAFSAGGYEPCRYIHVHSNTFSSIASQSAGAFDLHDNTQYCHVHNNTIKGGANFFAGDNTFENNIVYQHPSVNNLGNYGINAKIGRDCYFADIKNNTVISHGGGGTTAGVDSYGHLIIEFQTASVTVDTVNIIGNNLKGAVGFAHGCIHIRPLDVTITGYTINTLKIENNNVEITDTSGVARCIAVDDAGKGVAAVPTVIRAYINNNYLSEVSGNGRNFEYKVTSGTSDYLEFNGNDVIWSLSPVDVSTGYYPRVIRMSHNRFIRSTAGAGGIFRIQCPTDVTNITFNIFENVTSSSYYDVRNSTVAETYGNTLINCTGGTGTVSSVGTHVTAPPAL